MGSDQNKLFASLNLNALLEPLFWFRTEHVTELIWVCLKNNFGRVSPGAARAGRGVRDLNEWRVGEWRDVCHERESVEPGSQCGQRVCGETETQLHSGPGTGTHYLTHSTQEISAEPENRHQERRSQCLLSDFWVLQKVYEVWQHLLEKGNY